MNTKRWSVKLSLDNGSGPRSRGNTEISIPDVESMLHAFFDIVADGMQGVVSGAQVAELAMRHAGTHGEIS